MNTETLRCALHTFGVLLYREVMIFKARYWTITINSLFWVSAVLVPLMFFLPQMGLRDDFSKFLLPATAASWGFFDIIANSVTFIGDLTGDRFVDYELILPIPQWAIFVKIACANAYRSFSTSFFMLPVGAIVIYAGKGFTFDQINIFKTVLFLIVVNIFYGFFGLFASSFMYEVSEVRTIWMRVLLPLWWIGGFNHSWMVMYSYSPTFAYISLLDPLVYAMEGIRAATLGQEGFISYWYCLFALIGYSIVFGYFGTKQFQKRLDCL